MLSREGAGFCFVCGVFVKSPLFGDADDLTL